MFLVAPPLYVTTCVEEAGMAVVKLVDKLEEDQGVWVSVRELVRVIVESADVKYTEDDGTDSTADSV